MESWFLSTRCIIHSTAHKYCLRQTVKLLQNQCQVIYGLPWKTGQSLMFLQYEKRRLSDCRHSKRHIISMATRWCRYFRKTLIVAKHFVHRCQWWDFYSLDKRLGCNACATEMSTRRKETYLPACVSAPSCPSNPRGSHHMIQFHLLEQNKATCVSIIV